MKKNDYCNKPINKKILKELEKDIENNKRNLFFKKEQLIKARKEFPFYNKPIDIILKTIVLEELVTLKDISNYIHADKANTYRRLQVLVSNKILLNKEPGTYCLNKGVYKKLMKIWL